ncbi:MAG: hypothetical protein Q9195_007762 [Heterodermia aff. obscurata]
MPPRIISIRNKSGAPKRYGLVASPLSPDTDANGLPPHICLYKASKKIASPTGSAVFKIPDPMVAICGIADEGLKPGVRLSASDWASAQAATAGALGSRLTMRFRMGDAPTFDGAAAAMSVEGVGRWVVRAETGFEAGGSEPPFVGYGLADAGNADDVVPLVVWEAQPGAVYNVRCEQRWVVFCWTEDTIDDHEVLAVNGVGMVQSPHIDFRGTTASDVEVVHYEGDRFTVDFD